MLEPARGLECGRATGDPLRRGRNRTSSGCRDLAGGVSTSALEGDTGPRGRSVPHRRVLPARICSAVEDAPRRGGVDAVQPRGVRPRGRLVVYDLDDSSVPSTHH